MGTCFKIKMKNIWWLRTARLVQSKPLEALISPVDLESCCSSHPRRAAEHEHPLQAGCMLMLLAQQLNWRLYLGKGCNNVFSNWFGFPRFGLRRTRHMQPFYDLDLYHFLIIVFIMCKTSPYLFQLFGKMLQRCFPLKLQKCYVDHETSIHYSG